MIKFSEIESINEEFIGLLKKRKSEKEKKSDSLNYIKVSKKLLMQYVNNLLDNKYMRLHDLELESYDFVYYRTKAIIRIDDNKFRATISTYDDMHNSVGEETYLFEI